ncbi:ribosomal protein L33 [Lactococcus piscium]|nr:ribosomal protein L33 [Lactococcus piscium]SOB48549.1 ribosomal protein L33 [Lactococcus piscium]
MQLRQLIAKGVAMIKKSSLACTVCGSRNYSVTVSSNGRDKRLEVNKFCKVCGKYSLHKETR